VQNSRRSSVDSSAADIGSSSSDNAKNCPDAVLFNLCIVNHGFKKVTKVFPVIDWTCGVPTSPNLQFVTQAMDCKIKE